MSAFNQYGHFSGIIPSRCVEHCAAPGPADESVAYWQSHLGFNVPRGLAIPYLRETGGWTQEELEACSDTELAQKVLWLACHDIKENGEWLGVCR